MPDRTRILVTLALLALTFVGAGLFAWGLSEVPAPPTPLTISPSLFVYRQGPAGVERLREGDAVREGDLIQLEYAAAGRAHGAIVSVDGAGEATLHFPDAVGASTRLDRGGPRVLTHAFELDGAPGFERFILVTGERPVPVGDVMEAAAAVAAGEAPRREPLDGAWEQRSVVLEKGEP